MAYLPSKKIIYLTAAILLVFAGWFGVSKLKTGNYKSFLGLDSRKIDKTMENIVKAVPELDSDNDGLKDWEEVLYKTDINNPDSDGDGYPDGEEVRNNFNPLDPQSNPKTGKKSGELGEVSFLPPSSSANLTKELAKSMAPQVIKSGDQLDLSNPLKLINQETSQELANFIAGFNIRLSAKDFNVSSDNSRAEIQKYIDTITEIITTTSSFGSNISYSNVNRLISNRDFSFVNENIKSLEQAVDEMRKMTVPSDFFGFHKRATELLMSEEGVFKSIKEIETDPLKTILGMQEGERITKELDGLILQFTTLVKNHNINTGDLNAIFR